MISARAFHWFPCMTLLVLPLALAACSSQSSPDTAPALVAEPNSPVADVPVPAGYKIMYSRSTSEVNPASNVRVVDHSYSGGGSVLQVVKFYRDAMPKNGWTFVSQDEGSKAFTLKYTKPREALVVRVWRGTFATHIRVEIDPAANETSK